MAIGTLFVLGCVGEYINLDDSKKSANFGESDNAGQSIPEDGSSSLYLPEFDGYKRHLSEIKMNLDCLKLLKDVGLENAELELEKLPDSYYITDYNCYIRNMQDIESIEDVHINVEAMQIFGAYSNDNNLIYVSPVFLEPGAFETFMGQQYSDLIKIPDFIRWAYAFDNQVDMGYFATEESKAAYWMGSYEVQEPDLYDHNLVLNAKRGHCAILLRMSSTMDPDLPANKYHIYDYKTHSEINLHPDFDHGRARLKEIGIDLVQKIDKAIGDSCASTCCESRADENPKGKTYYGAGYRGVIQECLGKDHPTKDFAVLDFIVQPSRLCCECAKIDVQGIPAHAAVLMQLSLPEGISTIDVRHTEGILKELQYEMSGTCDPGAVAKFGELINPDYVIDGDITFTCCENGVKSTVKGYIRNAYTGEILETAAEESDCLHGAIGNGLKSTMEKVGKRLSTKLTLLASS